MEAKTKRTNKLWQLRHRAGLEQKQVANLLGHKSADQLSRYERGVRTPNFQTALKLARIYRTSAETLFPGLTAALEREVAQKTRAFAGSLPPAVAAALSSSETTAEDANAPEGTCEYAGLLGHPAPHERDLAAVRAHVMRLMRTMAHL